MANQPKPSILCYKLETNDLRIIQGLMNDPVPSKNRPDDLEFR